MARCTVSICTSSSRSPKLVVALPAPSPIAETVGPFLPSLRYLIFLGRKSVGFDPGRLDNRSPAHELGLHPIAQLFRRARRGGHALLEEGLLGLRVAQDLADLAVQLGDDALRRLRRG